MIVSDFFCKSKKTENVHNFRFFVIFRKKIFLYIKLDAFLLLCWKIYIFFFWFSHVLRKEPELYLLNPKFLSYIKF